MEATPTPRSAAPTSPGRRKRPHPAQRARKTAAMVSVGSFLALTGTFAVKAAVSSTPTTSATTGTTDTTVVTTDDGSSIVIPADGPSDLSTDDWAGTAPDRSGTTADTSGSVNTAPPVTQSHGS